MTPKSEDCHWIGDFLAITVKIFRVIVVP